MPRDSERYCFLTVNFSGHWLCWQSIRPTALLATAACISCQFLSLTAGRCWPTFAVNLWLYFDLIYWSWRVWKVYGAFLLFFAQLQPFFEPLTQLSLFLCSRGLLFLSDLAWLVVWAWVRRLGSCLWLVLGSEAFSVAHSMWGVLLVRHLIRSV